MAAVWIMWFIRRFPARESGAGRSRRRMPRSVRCRQRLELLLDRDQLGSESTSDLADHVAWAHRRQDGLGLAGCDVLLALSWNEFGQQSVQPVRGLDPALAQLVTPIAQHPQRLHLRVVGEHPKATGAHRDRGDGMRVVRVGLAVVPGVELAGAGRQLRRHVHDVLTIGQQPLRQWPSGTVAAFHRPHPVRVTGHVLSHRGVPGLVRGEAAGSAT
jgi:hypothetical protein